MPGYRFCRTDDVPLLVEAVNRCRGPESAGDPPLTLDDYKEAVRALDLWASSCMLAMEGSAPIGVMLAAKRDHATFIHTLQVHPGHRRQGHGRHMLASLGSKLAILGPPLLLAEVPAGREDLVAFLAACGFRPDATFTDFALEGPAPTGRPGAPSPEHAFPITVEDLLQGGLLGSALDRAWGHGIESLTHRAAALEGMAMGSDAGIEAWLLWSRVRQGREIQAWGCGASRHAPALLDILMDHFLAREQGPVAAPRVPAREAGAARLAGRGFRRTGDHVRLSARATPA